MLWSSSGFAALISSCSCISATLRVYGGRRGESGREQTEDGNTQSVSNTRNNDRLLLKFRKEPTSDHARTVGSCEKRRTGHGRARNGWRLPFARGRPEGFSPPKLRGQPTFSLISTIKVPVNRSSTISHRKKRAAKRVFVATDQGDVRPTSISRTKAIIAVFLLPFTVVVSLSLTPCFSTSNASHKSRPADKTQVAQAKS